MTLFLVLQLHAFALPVAMPPPPPVPVLFQDDDPLEREGPDPNPQPMHGAYEHARGWFCTKAPTNESVKNVQCACVEKCMNGGMEDHSCQTSCNSRRCKCHEDSSQCAPDVQATPKPKKGKR